MQPISRSRLRVVRFFYIIAMPLFFIGVAPPLLIFLVAIFVARWATEFAFPAPKNSHDHQALVVFFESMSWRSFIATLVLSFLILPMALALSSDRFGYSVVGAAYALCYSFSLWVYAGAEWKWVRHHRKRENRCDAKTSS